MDRNELIELVRKIQSAEGTEDQIQGMIQALTESVLDPRVTDYIFYPDSPLSPEEIVDKALAYRPIQL